MRKLAAIFALVAIAPLQVQAGERSLSGAQINALLPGVIVKGEGTSQVFSASGGTTFTDHGRDSFGSWTVVAERYCSKWPPGETLACYTVVVDDAPPDGGTAIIIWISEDGNKTTNTFSAKE